MTHNAIVKPGTH